MLALLLLLPACSTSGLGDPEATTNAENCPYVGEWSLVDVACGAFGTFAPFFERYDDASLVVSGAPAGCLAQITLRGAECAASEQWSIVVDAAEPSMAELESSGVIDCSPSGCSFDGVSPCIPGAAAGTGTAVIDLQESDLVVDGLVGVSADGLDCPLGLVGIFAASEP